MAIISNTGGVTHILKTVMSNVGGVTHELDTVRCNVNGVFYVIHKAGNPAEQKEENT